MSFLPGGAAMHLECPSCRWLKAVLASEQHGVGTAYCPHCQHLWRFAGPAKRVAVPRKAKALESALVAGR
jgi:Zn-finger nucleic acid-binding protein